MPKLPVKIKPGALPAVTEEVTQGVLDKLPQVDRREFLGGALSTLADTSALGKVADVLAPVAKVAPVAKKILNIREFIDTGTQLKLPLFSNIVNKFFFKQAKKGELGDDVKRLAMDTESGTSTSLSFEEFLDEAIELNPKDLEIPELKEAYYYFRGGEKGKVPNNFSKDIRSEFPDASSEDIANFIGDSAQADGGYGEIWQETQKILDSK